MCERFTMEKFFLRKAFWRFYHMSCHLSESEVEDIEVDTANDKVTVIKEKKTCSYNKCTHS